MKFIEQFHHSCLHNSMSIIRLDDVTNKEVFARAKMTNIEAMTILRQIRWEGHVYSMEDFWMPNTIYCDLHCVCGFACDCPEPEVWTMEVSGQTATLRCQYVLKLLLSLQIWNWPVQPSESMLPAHIFFPVMFLNDESAIIIIFIIIIIIIIM